MENENKILSAEQVKALAGIQKSLAFFCTRCGRSQYTEVHDGCDYLALPMKSCIPALCASHEALRDVLASLLDDSERMSAGFPNAVELRFAIRDAARAALKGKP